MSDSLSALYGGRGIALTHGRGSRVFDTAGREYLDFFNGHGASLFGHSHQLLIEALENASKGIWTSGAGFESPVREKLADKLGLMLGEGRVFLCNSGTEAIEAALKLVLTLRKGRGRILACRRGFHGRTCGALSITFNPKYREPFIPLIGKAEHFSMEDLAENIDDDTAAVFIEPVQGEGGVFAFLQKEEIKLPKRAENTLFSSYPMRYRAASEDAALLLQAALQGWLQTWSAWQRALQAGCLPGLWCGKKSSETLSLTAMAPHTEGTS